MIAKKDFINMGGMNSDLEGWAWEDLDLIARLKATTRSANAAVRLVKSAPNLMQRLSRLPTAPNVMLLDRRKPKPHP